MGGIVPFLALAVLEQSIGVPAQQSFGSHRRQNRRSCFLGIFTVSVELSQMPTSELVAPINRAVFPAYAQISGELPRLQQSYIDVVGMIALLAIPAAVGLATLADVVVPVILGPKWVAAVPLIRILGIAGAITTLETNIGAAYLALGRPEILTKLYGFYVALLVVLLVPFTYQWGVMGAAGPASPRVC